MRDARDSAKAGIYSSGVAVARFAGYASYVNGPGVPLRSTPGRGPQPSISAGVLDFTLSPALRALVFSIHGPGVPLRFTPGFMLSPRYAGSNSRNLFRAS